MPIYKKNMNTSENNKRIAKNTLLLYVRMLFMMLVSLYTSRIVLNTLGVEDFGIYNVVGGVVSMFGFLNRAMFAATQRYLTFELGKNNFERLKVVFSTSVTIHILISVLVFLLAETIGLWFLYNKMTIPAERMDAAFWVYQLAILSTMVLIISVPYNATIIAHERMGAFAYISIIEVSLKLLLVFSLNTIGYDKLILYALFFFLTQLIIRIIYGRYCSRHFDETKYKFIWDKNLFKEMFLFAGWNLWGNCAYIAFTQGINVILNIFFGPAVNAARGVAVQVQSAVQQFSTNFQMALNPQITKSYATNNLEYMHKLIFSCSKFTFLLLFFLSLPIMINTEYVLKLWLKIAPDYTVVFLRLILCITIIDSMSAPFMISAAATGKVKRYQSIVGGILLSIVPISYIVLHYGGEPYSVFIVHLLVCVIAFIVRLYIIRPMIKLSIYSYFKNVILRCFLVIICALPIPIITSLHLSQSFVSFLIVSVLSCFTVLLFGYNVGLGKDEKIFISEKIRMFIHKLKK